MSDGARILLLTGASGVLGGHLLRRLSGSGVQLRVLTSGRSDAAKFAPLPPENVHRFDELEENPGLIAPGSIVIHAGFARTPGGKELAASIDSAQRLFTVAVREKAAGILNISSQSVYSPARQQPAKESDAPAPADLYGMAKFACERLGESISAGSSTRFTSLRLGSLIGPEYPERILSKFLARMLKRQNLKLIGGRQVFSLLDVRDAAEAVIAFSKMPPERWEACYNLGNPVSIPIAELARRAAAAVRRITGFEAAIELEETDLALNSSLDSERFRAMTGWAPRHTLEESIDTILSFMAGQN